MKKLRIYDHLGQLVKEFDVYVEGQSFTWRASKPEVLWLGTITLQDADEKAQAPEGTVTDLTPELELEYIEEVESELETVGDKSTGDGGADKAEQSEGAEVTYTIDTVGDAAKRSKRDRQSKTAPDTLGSRSKQRASRSSRKKTKGNNVGEV